MSSQKNSGRRGRSDPPAGPSGDDAGLNSAQRLSAREILLTVVQSGRDELARPLSALALSALAGGLTVGLSALALALLRAGFGNGDFSRALQAGVYPVGFIAVIIGREQFFTENTLFPVVTYLDDHRHGPRLLWFWGVVLGCNLLGAFLFALLAVLTNAVSPNVRLQLIRLGLAAAAPGFAATFWSGVIAGWIMAMVAWTVSASRWTSGQILVIWLLTMLIGLGQFAHSVASSTEILAAVVAGQLSLWSYFGWLPAALFGNVAGGVVIVSVLNYGQVHLGGG